jgi:hypothetical protein
VDRGDDFALVLIRRHRWPMIPLLVLLLSSCLAGWQMPSVAKQATNKSGKCHTQFTGLTIWKKNVPLCVYIPVPSRSDSGKSHSSPTSATAACWWLLVRRQISRTPLPETLR